MEGLEDDVALREMNCWRKCYHCIMTLKLFRLLKYVVTVSLHVIDMMTDVLVMLELIKLGYDRWWLVAVFIFAPYFFTLLMLYGPFVGWLKRHPERHEQHSYCWIITYTFFGIPCMIFYDVYLTVVGILSVGTVQPREMGKLYHVTKLSNEAIFEAIPQIIFQFFLQMRVTSLIFMLSILASAANIIRAIFHFKKFAAYMRVSPAIRGAYVSLLESSGEKIQLSNSQIKDKEAEDFANGLQRNFSLRSLDFSKNE
eukprot:TRINITY_DN120_c0_g1_i1.p1 TRINITY_DN120_c0_g1~~TRINITY_DN120_c0_g1_i1.p1  ORF type:complete len:255 (+),score=23.27 TRINITY_DN120_c0_g1_i1:344-1108(+)